MLDELIAGNPHSDVIQIHLDIILTWLARPDSEKVEEFRNAYLQRKISDEILRGYVLFILEQKLFSNENFTAHQVLALHSDASKEQIKSRYQKLIRIYHPDRGIGDPRILHQHAEKINQAYQHLTTNTVSANNNTRPTYSVNPSTVTTSPERANSSVHTVMGRKLRRKFGDARKFQMVFFGVLASVCLLLILLIYIQPETVNSGQSSSKKQDYTETINQAGDVTSPVEEQKVDDLSFVDTLAISTDPEDTVIKDNNTELSDGSIQSATKLEQSTQEIQTITDKDSIVADELDTQRLKDEVVDQIDLSDSLGKVEEKLEEKAINSLLQNPDEANFSQSEQKTTPPEQPLPTEETSIQIKQNEPTSKKVDQNSPITKKTDIKKVPQQQEQAVIPKIVTDEKTPNLNQADEQQANKSKKESKSVIEIEVEPKSASQENVVDTQPTSDQVQIKEIQVAKIIKPVQNYAKANLFERRFARKFVVRYLESIEQGNISLINDFLSDSLSINGISNNKHNYLKRTTQMISDSNQRSYHINFIGDVLRLDKGSFRVTLKERQTVIFKNNRKTQTSSTKSYDIKRYSYGSEIVSISDV